MKFWVCYYKCGSSIRSFRNLDYLRVFLDGECYIFIFLGLGYWVFWGVEGA